MNDSTGRTFRIVRWIVRIALVAIMLLVANGRIEVPPTFLKAVSLLLGAIAATMLCLAMSSSDVRSRHAEFKWNAGGLLLFAGAIGAGSIAHLANFALLMIMAMLLFWRGERLGQRRAFSVESSAR